MKQLNTYLTFDGNCRDAMTFYEKCLGGELHLMPFSDAQGQCDLPADAKDRVMHACLSKGGVLLMASDAMPGMALKEGNNFSINISCESRQEIEKLFAALGESGKITMPLQDTFWGAHFGMLTDRFGINWMFNYEYPKQA
jgi:PhnB protein